MNSFPDNFSLENQKTVCKCVNSVIKQIFPRNVSALPANLYVNCSDREARAKVTADIVFINGERI